MSLHQTSGPDPVESATARAAADALPATALNPAAWLSRLRTGVWPVRRPGLASVRSLDEMRTRRQAVRLRSAADRDALGHARAQRHRRALERAAARPADLPRPGLHLLSG